MNPLEYRCTLDGSMYRAIETDDPIALNSIVYLISCKGNCPAKDSHLTKQVCEFCDCAYKSENINPAVAERP